MAYQFDLIFLRKLLDLGIRARVPWFSSGSSCGVCGACQNSKAAIKVHLTERQPWHRPFILFPMTIAIAWTRKVLDYEQLLFVSDSRISGGATFDACPKVLTLPRTDCAVAFAGYEGHAFPMMLQLGLAIDAFPKAKRGAHEMSRVCKHALCIFDGMAGQIETTIKSEEEALGRPDATFVFGGYSWRLKRFQIWTIEYNQTEKEFQAHPAPNLRVIADGVHVGRSHSTRLGSSALGRIAIAGDQKREAYRRLRELVEQRIKDNPNENHFLDMEPFEVVRDMLRDPAHSSTIGGAPQVVKVFQYLRSSSFAVYWPDKKTGVPYLHGRPILPYEWWDKQVIDPDTLHEESIPVRTSFENAGFEDDKSLDTESL
jgi:hypothetical protein